MFVYKRVRDLREDNDKTQKEIAARLAKIEKEVPANIMELYKQKRADKIFPILYQYSGNGFCPNCRTEISKLAESNIAKEGVIVCDNCGRLLYK